MGDMLYILLYILLGFFILWGSSVFVSFVIFSSGFKKIIKMKNKKNWINSILESVSFWIFVWFIYDDYDLFKTPSEGTVFDKKIIYPEMDYIPARYKLYIVGESQIWAMYEVPEDVYYMYSIGDWFDSENLGKIKAAEEKEIAQIAKLRA